MNIFDVLQVIGGIIVVLSYFPQIFKILSTKTVKGLSAKFFGILTLGMGLMCINAFHLVKLGVFSYAITQLANVALSVLVLSLIIYYRNKTSNAENLGELLRHKIDISMKENDTNHVVDVSFVNRQVGKTAQLIEHWESLNNKSGIHFIVTNVRQKQVLLKRGIPENSIELPKLDQEHQLIFPEGYRLRGVMFDEGLSIRNIRYLVENGVKIELGFYNMVYQ